MKPETEVGLARAMVELIRQAAQHPEQHASAYLCYWMAFTSIYAALGAQAGVKPHFGLNKNGTLQTHRVGALKMAEVFPPADSMLLAKASEHFPHAAKHKLVIHEDTRFFVYRTPVWQGKSITADGYRQRLNGVIDMRCTMDSRYPVWSPIDARMYTAYTCASAKGEPDDENLNVLVEQVLDVLHTVYCNLLYSDKPTVDENAPTVIGKALSLLSSFVEDLLQTK
jgi:hypothetical protein